MFDLSNLNDNEFEILCKDIMERKLMTTLHRFAKGRDGGVDLCDSKETMQYMIQVKHYIKSTYHSLKIALKAEVEKVKKNNPQSYYVCCSMELTRKNKLEILSLFPNYIKDISYIFDKTEIDDFLSKKENKGILEKNYKLWLSSINILSLISNQHAFIDCNALIDDINNYVKLFVDTRAFHDCKKKLLKNNVIIITGAPGVGKSTISKMLLLFFVSKKYSVRYVTDNDIKSIKNILSRNPLEKEIVLLDDFLGQHYLKVYDKQPNELKTLISFVENSPNKKIIMNSRITIINEAHSASQDFANLIDKYDKDKYLIDLDKMSLVEKAKILYNHLYFSELPVKYLKNIKENRNYAKIIDHQNYNPRIIEYVTKTNNYKSVDAKEYIDYILSKLDNPEDVWEDEFRNRLQEEDRIFMNTLYSLTNSKINIDFLKYAFNKRIIKITSNTTLDRFEEVMHRLTNSLIKIVIENGKRYVCVVNPSINDYLSKKIENNNNEQISIIKNAKYIEQVVKFQDNKETIYEIIYNNEISLLDSVNKHADYSYFSLIIKYNIKDLRIKDYIELAFSKFCKDFSIFKEDRLLDIIEKGYVKFYGLEKILVDNLKKISCNLSYDNLLAFFNWYKKERLKINKDELTIFHDCFIYAIEDHVIDLINDDLQAIVETEIGVISSNYYSIDDYYQPIEDEVERLIDEKLSDILINLPFIDKSEIDLIDILDGINIEDSIKSYLNDESDLFEDDYYEDSDLISKTYREWDIIDKIFS